eukprot:TRINITY_DN42966_c0_g1_i1.p1 TRINITY_DN42966_c0_g1~~TRINITY_DN42966_c0_g1_i1.p1  ORF type:complete len:399 (-),score=59.60 TRINITY_DN42966_c0_g1_i1:185-1381(-)
MENLSLRSLSLRIRESASCFFSVCVSLGQSKSRETKDVAITEVGTVDEADCPRKVCRVDDRSPPEELSVVAHEAGACAATQACARQLAVVFDLPDVMDGIGTACCDPWLLSRLGMAAKHLWSTVASPGFAVRRAQELSAQGMEEAVACKSLEHLAIALDVAKMCGKRTKNHVYFPYGGGVDVQPRTRHLLTSAAKLTRHHPRVRLHVDAHAGVGAPSGGIALDISKRRAEAVIQELVTRGLHESRLSRTGWGKKVSSRWSEPEDDTAARAELYIHVDGMEFPKRPDYYALVPAERRPVPAGEGEGAPEASSDEELAGGRGRGVVGVRLRNGQLISLAALMAMMHDDAEDDDADDGTGGNEANDSDGRSESGADDDSSSSSSTGFETNPGEVFAVVQRA